MIVPKTFLGLMLLQEVGFDIVSMLTAKQMAYYVAGGVIIIVALCSLFVITRKRGRSE